ncbi:MAG TPA: ketoacyl-ACP synthase III [Bryobacteraceae bacterium]|nr:ketoacyl-ACP synthase III [Bryobacteraceae bacterium]
MSKAAIQAIEYYLPEAVLGSEELAREFPEWSVAKIEEKTGIRERHIASEAECSSDLGIAAARKLFASGHARPEEIDFLLFCTQSPDYFLPTTACIVQNSLGLPKRSGALDFNLGCSGFIYGLGLAKGLIETGQASNVLLITSETYSKFIHKRDKSVRTIFGDAAAATLISAKDIAADAIGPFVFGTDGAGADNLIVRSGGMRQRALTEDAMPDDDGNWRSPANLYMNGAELFSFTMSEVPASVKALLSKTNTTVADYDLFVFHQANGYMLNHLRKSLKIPEDRFFVHLEECGNTVSSTIPIALAQAEKLGRLRAGSRVLLAGFGVGYSWGVTSVRWK